MKKAKPSKNKNGKERGFGVILEHMDSKFDLVLEGQQALDVKIDKVDANVKELKSEMDYKFETVFDELHIIRNDLKEKVGRDEFVALEKRVMHLEKSLPRR